jgi:hypothetical protein
VSNPWQQPTGDDAAAPPIAPEPQPASATAPSKSAGTAVVLLGAGALTGLVAGGLWGAGAGALLVGATRNALRAKGEWQSDAGSAAQAILFALAGMGLGGYCAYKAYQSSTGLQALE